jgi:hypothetical protein
MRVISSRTICSICARLAQRAAACRSRTELTDQPGAQHQSVTGGLGIGGHFAERRDEHLGPAHGRI